ncbi:MAG: DUF2721 domain-containing protein [Candidatus Margulisiibacteriota bacterium]|nr:DUF2721 domain-containing protein [Candidatus Margulisiibacteriota bacterium]
MLSLTTPAMLFPAISLLLLAYTNRFLALSQLIRALHLDYQNKRLNTTLKQIHHLRYRVKLIRLMQFFGSVSIFCCIISIFTLLIDRVSIGYALFVISLFMFLLSILFSIIEIVLSSRALNILLSDIESK